MLRLDHVLVAIACLLVAFAWRAMRERRHATAGFWALLGVLVGTGRLVLDAAERGEHGPGAAAGLAVIGLAVLAPRMERPIPSPVDDTARRASAERLGHRLLVPALVLPAVVALVTLGGPHVRLGDTPVIDTASTTLVGVALAALVALGTAMVIVRPPPGAPLEEGRRLAETIGWAAVLPMFLASLGSVLTESGAGDAIAAATTAVLPTESALACALAYGVAMFVLTITLGNAFAAFPIATAGIGLPLCIELHGGDAATLGALGMLAGYCGTLLTPMAANFNVVPVALLELEDRHAVIRAQMPTALVMFVVQLVLLALAVRP